MSHNELGAASSLTQPKSRPWGITLVMATLGRSLEVGKMIQSLANQTDRRFELLIVDQNGDDRLVPYVQEGLQAGLDIHHIRLSLRGLSLARNAGLQHTKYALVGFPDDDCWYEPDLVEQVLLRFADKPGIAGVVACWEEQWAVLGRKSDGDVLSSAAWRNFRGGHASSISLFFRADLVDEIGGFDEKLGVGTWFGAGEETDFLLRALASGGRLEYVPAARVHHLFAAPGSPILQHRLRSARLRGRGTGGLYVKHRLSAWVRLRGYFAPPVTSLIRTWRIEGLLSGLATAVGRIEGSLAWRWLKK